MKRGELWTVAGGGDYTNKPRPGLILQDDRFESMESVTLCVLTTDLTDAPLFRIKVEATDINGLEAPSCIMVDKITTVRRARLGMRIGQLNDDDLTRVNRAILIFLGFTGSTSAL